MANSIPKGKENKPTSAIAWWLLIQMNSWINNAVRVNGQGKEDVDKFVYLGEPQFLRKEGAHKTSTITESKPERYSPRLRMISSSKPKSGYRRFWLNHSVVWWPLWDIEDEQMTCDEYKINIRYLRRQIWVGGPDQHHYNFIYVFLTPLSKKPFWQILINYLVCFGILYLLIPLYAGSTYSRLFWHVLIKYAFSSLK